MHPNRLAFFCLLLFSYFYSISQPAIEPVGKFHFNNGKTVNEITGEYFKAVGASSTEDRFGNPASAWFLHGSSGSYLNLGTSKTLKPSIGSVSLWFKIDNITYSGTGYYSNPIILTKSHEGNSFFEAYAISIDFSNWKISTTSALSGARQISLRSSKPIPIGQWCHVVFAYDDSYTYLYLNGELNGKMAKGFRTHFLASDSVMIGNSANVMNSRYFNGSVDDIDIYDRVLSPSEVKTLYNAPDPNIYNRFNKWVIQILEYLCLVAILVWITSGIYRRKLEKEKQKNILMMKMHKMEIQVMKAQMNPHFIFNAMNSVQQFILAGDNRNAHKYLGKFSQLLRRILDSNNEENITLENEIDMLTKYIEIESLRFKHAFNFEIVTDTHILSSKIKIPQMLIQPVIENAIWHGLLPQKNNKKLNVRFKYMNRTSLLCIVEDNGVGRKKNEAHKVWKGNSMALNFIRQRLSSIKDKGSDSYGLRIIDKTNDSGKSEGTTVEIIMPIVN
jgi:two-component sensor histidine kinase